MGSSKRYCCEACPVPKSSIRTLMPSSRSLFMGSMIEATLEATAVSVTSISRKWGENLYLTSWSSKSLKRAGFEKFLMEKLMLTGTNRPFLCQTPIWLKHVSTTHFVKRSEERVPSIRGINSSGETEPKMG